jgi:hypothetical protein
MGFEVSVCLFNIDPASFSPVKSNIKTLLDKSLLDTVNFSHACVQHYEEILSHHLQHFKADMALDYFGHLFNCLYNGGITGTATKIPAKVLTNFFFLGI